MASTVCRPASLFLAQVHMSDFFRTLLRRPASKRSGAPMAEAATAEPDAALLDLPTGSDRLAKLATVKKQNAHATLLDAMRTVAGKSQTPSVVVAGIASNAPASSVVEGVVDQAALRGVRLQIGDVVVTQSHRTLSIRQDHAAAPEPIDDDNSLDSSLSLELTAPSAQETLKSWFDTAGSGFDLLIVAAPPILSSVDALLVARACDGLVLVAEPLTTLREEFEIAVERARASGCRMLGLVMNENRDWLPGFLSRLFSSYPRSISSRTKASN